MKRRNLFLVLFILFVIGFSFFVMSKISQNKRACLSLNFDDGLKSHYSVVYPRLKEKNFGATFFIIANDTQEFDDQGYVLMNPREIQELADNGFEIGSHTLSHPFLTSLNEGEIAEELKNSQEILQKEYDVTVTSLAFSYGDYDKGILNMAKKYYLTARAVYNQNPLGFFLKGNGLESNSSVEEICDYINYANENKQWLIFVFHDITEKPRRWDTSIEDFEEILDCAEATGIKVSSLRDCREHLN